MASIYACFYAALTLIITLGMKWCGMGLLYLQELPNRLEKPGFEFDALITVAIDGSPPPGICNGCGFFIGYGESLY